MKLPMLIACEAKKMHAADCAAFNSPVLRLHGDFIALAIRTKLSQQPLQAWKRTCVANPNTTQTSKVVSCLNFHALKSYEWAFRMYMTVRLVNTISLQTSPNNMVTPPTLWVSVLRVLRLYLKISLFRVRVDTCRSRQTLHSHKIPSLHGASRRSSRWMHTSLLLASGKRLR